jgi:hypothetical protein
MNSGIGSHTLPNDGGSNDWITPEFILDALGEFDLDPCACITQPWDTAKVMWCDGGLDWDWFGRVWMNPPYGKVTGAWLQKLSEYGNGIALIFARTETVMFQRYVWKRADALFFFDGRLFFHRPSGERGKTNAGGPSVLVAYGDNNVESLRNSGLRGALVEGWSNI